MKGKKIKYSQECRELIERMSAEHKKYKEIAEEVNKIYGLGVTDKNVSAYCKRNRCLNGNDATFKKGGQPYNKGKKWDEFMSKESQSKCKATCFTKGKNVNNQKHNNKEMGYERVTRDGYVEVKVYKTLADAKKHGFLSTFRLKHRLLWESAYGEIPKDKVITFKNGNKADIRLDNLMMIDQYENRILNHPKRLIDRTNPETIELEIDLIKINKIIKEIGNEK